MSGPLLVQRCPTTPVKRIALAAPAADFPPPAVPAGFVLADNVAASASPSTTTTTSDTSASSEYRAISFCLGNIYCYSCIGNITSAVTDALAPYAGVCGVTATRVPMDVLCVVVRRPASDPLWDVVDAVEACVAGPHCGKACFLLTRHPGTTSGPPSPEVSCLVPRWLTAAAASSAAGNASSASAAAWRAASSREFAARGDIDAALKSPAGAALLAHYSPPAAAAATTTECALPATTASLSSSSLAAAAAATTSPTAAAAPGATSKAPAALQFVIEGMSCTSCASKIERALVKMPGVAAASVVYATCSASVTPKPSEDPASMRKVVVAVVTAQGFQCTAIGGGGGGSRGRRAADTATGASVPIGGGGGGADADHTDADGDGDGGDDDDNEVTRRAIERGSEIAELTRTTVVAVCGGLPLLLIMIAMMIAPAKGPFMTAMHLQLFAEVTMETMIGFLCSTPVVFYSGRPFFTRAWRSFSSDYSMNMDTLVAVGVGVAYGSSVLVTLLMSCFASSRLATNYDTAAVLLSFMCAGKLMEAKAKRMTGDALLSLMNIVPRMAVLVAAVGADRATDRTVPTKSLRPGQLVRVLPGCAVPTDGVVAAGASDVGEALVTGEPLPVAKVEGSSVIGGTQNLGSELIVRVTKVGKDTVVANILNIVRTAQQSKPSLLRVSDRIASVFVPAVLALAFVVMTVWSILGAADAYPAEWRAGMPAVSFAFSFCLATVVVACPCALGLAAPTAIMVGTGVGAHLGILLKSAESVERANAVNCVVFDKTGTLTTGEMNVTEIVTHVIDDAGAGAGAVAGASPSRAAAVLAPENLIQCVAALEARSVHPIAKAICRRAADTRATATTGSNIDVEAWSQVAGRGISAVVRFGGGSGAATHRISIGSLRFLAEDEQCTNVTDRARTIVGGLTRGGGTGPQQQIVVVCVAVDRRFVATIHLSDTIKSDARATVAYLRYVIGAEVWMVTGDAMQSALAVANDVGIDPACIEAHMMPEQKVDVVKRLQQDGTRVVAFVGDGINDAAALSQANVGIAIGAGTDVAIDAADAVLVQEALFNVCTLLDLTRAVIRRIYFNFAWACMYNIVMLPISSGCFFFLLRKQLPPVVAGAAMMMSSLSVVCSSLLLRCYRPPSQDDALATLRGRRRAIGSNPRLGNELVGLLNPDA